MFNPKIFLLILLFIFNAYGEGGPPMLTDGPGTPGDGNWEINTAFTGDLRHGANRYGQPAIDVNYGLGDDIQLKAETSYIGLHTQEQHSDGVGNAKLGIKWRFYEKDDFLISTYPQFTFTPIHNALAELNRAYLLPIEMTKKIDDFWITVEGGYIWITDAPNKIKYGAIFGYELDSKLVLMTELFSSSKIGGDEKTTIANFGLTQTMSQNITLLLSLGKEIKTPEPNRGTLFYCGFGFKF